MLRSIDVDQLFLGPHSLLIHVYKALRVRWPKTWTVSVTGLH